MSAVEPNTQTELVVADDGSIPAEQLARLTADLALVRAALEVAESRVGDRLDPAARFFVEELFGP